MNNNHSGRVRGGQQGNVGVSELEDHNGQNMTSNNTINERYDENINDQQNSEWDNHMTDLQKTFDQELKRIQEMPADARSFKDHKLPLARIKKIMKSDEDVSMISSEAPILFSKALELFITDITKRASFFTKNSKRKTLQKQDIIECVKKSDLFDFLIDTIPKDDYSDNLLRRNNISISNTPLDSFNPNRPLQMPGMFPPPSGMAQLHNQAPAMININSNLFSGSQPFMQDAFGQQLNQGNLPFR